MGKKALYRKHRSKSFDEVVGQSHITDTLKNALKKGAVSHAYLFTGPKGVGKTSVARILAHEINDLDYADEATHLDIIEIDAASNRRIDEIRELRDKVHIAPTTAKYKVYIIDEVHMLTREAFNALLKTLEEPPEHAIFILATTEAHKVPDTIVSRTQRYTFKPITAEAATDHLKSIAKTEKIKISDEAIALLAQHGQGSFRDSISMLDQLSGLAKDSYDTEDVRLLLGIPTSEVINTLIDAVAGNNQSAIFEAVHELREQGIDANRAAKALSSTLREQLVQNNARLDQSRTIKLLQNLLDLTGANGDFLGLELALLDVIEQSTQKAETEPAAKPSKTVEQKATQSTSVEPKPGKPAKKESKTEQKKQPVKKPVSDIKDLSNVWQEMLDDVKATHNTLYGVLRMAEPSHEDGLLVLTFGFDFHKKQLESDKNKPIIRDYLQKYIGNAKFSAVVKKAANKPVEKPAENHVDSEQDAAVDTVSNIFGSAELLES